MIHFFLDYSIFIAKLLTLIFVFIFTIVMLIALTSKKNNIKHNGSVNIENVNDKYENLEKNLLESILDKKEYKKHLRQKKFEARKQNKGKKIKENNYKSRLFIIRFYGDIHATEVDSLRECITAIIMIANQNDEILVIVDSAGGIVHHYGLAASQIKRIREHKLKLTIAVDLIAASGGYMMACVADHIIAAPFAVIGSIGVIAQLPNFNKLLNRFDIEIEQHAAGEYKTTLTTLGKNTDKGREKFQEELNDTHELFKSFVSTHRPQVKIDEIATGEHWYGSQAIDKGLIDKILTSDDYILQQRYEKDIYELSYKYQETFKEKIQGLLENRFKSLVNFISRNILNLRLSTNTPKL